MCDSPILLCQTEAKMPTIAQIWNPITNGTPASASWVGQNSPNESSSCQPTIFDQIVPKPLRRILIKNLTFWLRTFTFQPVIHPFVVASPSFHFIFFQFPISSVFDSLPSQAIKRILGHVQFYNKIKCIETKLPSGTTFNSQHSILFFSSAPSVWGSSMGWVGARWVAGTAPCFLGWIWLI